MTSTQKFTIIALALLAFAATVYAQTPQEQLQHLVAQLQKTPTDNVLQEKIIKLAVTMKPAPEIPEDARRPFVRGNTAIKAATSADDYANAVKLYQEALLMAPWWADAYFNLAKAQELHQDYDAAILSTKFFLMTSPPATEARDAQDHIYALEELRDKKSATDNVKAAAEKVENDKRQAEQAKRDVITKLKNIVNNRSYDNKILSYSGKSADVWGGVSKNELFGGGTYYTFPFQCPSTWKFFDDRVELWQRGGACDQADVLAIVGESWGPELTDMHWFNNFQKGADREASRYTPSAPQLTRTWGYFEVSRGYLYLDFIGVMPLKDSEVDPNRRYVVSLYKPF